MFFIRFHVDKHAGYALPTFRDKGLGLPKSPALKI